MICKPPHTENQQCSAKTAGILVGNNRTFQHGLSIIEFNGDASKICTIKLSWGKYTGHSNILKQHENELAKLLQSGFKVNVEKVSSMWIQLRSMGLCSCEGFEPPPQMILAILACILPDKVYTNHKMP